MTDVQRVTHGMTAASERIANAMTPLNAKDSTQGNDATDASNAANSTITASDFLTLLVTELKNQDPTQPTDPNSYIQQLVGVNSLEQLIQINQEVGDLNPSSDSSGT
jgi:flagellar basal-body rod modification protein FlgD